VKNAIKIHVDYFLLAASLCILGGGCAADSPTMRVVEICAVRTETESSGAAGLSASVATNLFHDLATHFGRLGRVLYENHYGNPRRPTWVEYSVHFTPDEANSVDLFMDIDGEHITFRGMTEPETIAALQKAMKLCRESLDERRIKYTVRTYETHPLTPPPQNSFNGPLPHNPEPPVPRERLDLRFVSSQ
jgi:hypothetical protein